MPSPARTAAFHALRAVSTGRSDLPAALARARTFLTDNRDRALTAEIVTGTLRWQRSLDYLAECVAARPLEQIDPDVLVILRLSLYQLLHLDRVPAAAVVDDAVDLTRSAKHARAAGFVNALLRTTLRKRRALPLPARPSDRDDVEAAVRYLGVTHSHPEWLIRRWLARYGFEAVETWVRFDNATPALTLRANRLRATRAAVQGELAARSVETEPTATAPDGLRVVSGNPMARAGPQEPAGSLFVVQDEASQLVPLALGAQPGERVLDLCASPGGKATALAVEVADAGLVVACDVRPARLALLRRTVAASGANRVQIVRIPTAGALPFAPVFDRILVDAPCSGLGTIRRDPDIRWRRHETDLATFATHQLDLLTRAAQVLAPRGRLVYATCSSEPEENQQVVRAFLEATPGFRLLDLRSDAPPALQAVLHASGTLRTTPFEHGLEAFFAAALVRS